MWIIICKSFFFEASHPGKNWQILFVIFFSISCVELDMVYFNCAIGSVLKLYKSLRIELQVPWVRSKEAREGWIVHSHPFISLVSIYDCWIYLFLVHFPLEIEVQCHIHKSFSKRFWNFPLKLNNKAEFLGTNSLSLSE